MTLIGIDLGSHSASIAVWHDDKNMLEVLADDLGFRTIPCVVAFRGEETIVGHSAVSQRHKNAMNTFSEVRSLLFNYEQSHCSVPALEKDMTVEEINSIFFRNIHNQVKQQAGKVIRDAVITVPQPLDEATKKRYIEAAQHGGIRIKSFLEDSTAALLAYGFDEPNNHHASRVLVADLGWSRSTVSVYNISNGAFNLQGSKSSTDVCGKIFVKLLSDFCAKEFLKKNKVPVTDNKRAMMRLTHECELAIKALSTGTEATIDIDSLCEGIDYSSKISRARLEDLLSIPVIHFKNLVNNVLKDLSLTGNSINSICLSGGPSSMPKFINILKQLLPNATFPKVRFETSEAPAIGAAVHGKHLFELVSNLIFLCFLSCFF
jgi:L1 cell adhesion molecule like protein